MTTEGFVKLPRTMLEWQWFDDGNTLKVYLALLLSANWKDAEWHGIKLKRGQLITSVKSLCEKCHMTTQQVRTALAHLTSTNEITIKKTSKFSLVTLNNYDPSEEVNNKNNNVSTTYQQDNNNVSTTCQQDSNNVLTTVEERKEEKEIKEKEEAAAPLASPLLSDNSLNSMPNDNPITKDELTAKYGEENVAVYSRKFDIWADRKGITGVNKLGTIAKWLAEDGCRPRDGVTKQTSSFDQREVMRNILHKYGKPVDTDGEK